MQTPENYARYPPAELLIDNGTDESLKRRFAILKLEWTDPPDNGSHYGVRFFEMLESGTHYRRVERIIDRWCRIYP